MSRALRTAPREAGLRDARVMGLGLAAVLAWDLTGLDLPMARWFGSATGFALREHWLFANVLHQQARMLGWLVALVLLVLWWRPVGAHRSLNVRQRGQLLITPLVATLVISLLKQASHASCPWDLNEFGGSAHPVVHWLAFVQGDGGPGHCFPAGHAVTGFGFVGGYFVFRDHKPRLARCWLWAALSSGLVLGLAQQVRGAHYMSHTLWSAWLSFGLAAGLDLMRVRLDRARLRAPSGGQPAPSL